MPEITSASLKVAYPPVAVDDVRPADDPVVRDGQLALQVLVRPFGVGMYGLAHPAQHLLVNVLGRRVGLVEEGLAQAAGQVGDVDLAPPLLLLDVAEERLEQGIIVTAGSSLGFQSTRQAGLAAHLPFFRGTQMFT